uniref:Putative DNA primase/helicase n=1 Tax=Candidatus Kentrum sp. LFY TaxID=2126342 RepID=A0A450WD24_9GAMM|nr:MAG: putative DNA primase/helicase [Candidatus Kentron sp. LFY]
MTPLTLEAARDALSYIPSDDRETWLRMAMAVKSEFGEEGFSLWDEWSAASGNYNQKDARDVWKSVHPTGKSGSVTIASLIGEAKRAGWTEPQENLSAQQIEQRKRKAAQRREEARKKAEAAEKALDAAREEIAKAAEKIWDLASEEGKSPYLDRKRGRAFGVRFVQRAFIMVYRGDPDEAERLSIEFITDPDKFRAFFERNKTEKRPIRFLKVGALLVPMRDGEGRLRNFQIIWGSGKKTFLRYGRKQGRFHALGALMAGGLALLCEGYATAASLHMATGYPVVCAFDAGNLPHVARVLGKRYPNIRLLLCADDDYLTDKNPGVTAARAAAAAVSGHVVIPQFPLDRKGEKLTDFNDLANCKGAGSKAIREQIEAALADAKWDGTKAWLQGAKSAQSVMPVDALVERFVPIDDGTGKHLFDLWEKRPVHRDQMVALLPSGERFDRVKRHPMWIDRGGYFMRQIGFDPAGNDPGVLLNTWSGWPVRPKEGKCERLLELVQYLCNRNQEGEHIAKWLLQWMAYPLQHPGGKMTSAVIMHGPPGTGKSSLWKVYRELYGEYAVVISQRSLEDRFNADWVDRKLLVVAEEVINRQDMFQVRNELKELITGSEVRINPKMLPAYQQKNRINLVFLSNEDMPLPLDPGDRRYFVVYTPPPLSPSFYDTLWEEIEHGGIAAFYHYLLHLDLKGFRPKGDPPRTQAKKELLDVSRPSEEQFLTEWINGETPHPFGPCAGMQLYTAYNRWCRVNGIRFPRNKTQFLNRVSKMPGWVSGDKGRYRIWSDMTYSGEQTMRRFVLPDPELLKAHDAARPIELDLHQWLTNCYVIFQSSFEKEGYGA